MQGDADTNAAIAGGLIGFYYGWENMDLITKENWNKIINTDLSLGNFKRPELYHPKNYDNLLNLI